MTDEKQLWQAIVAMARHERTAFYWGVFCGSLGTLGWALLLRVLF